MKSPFAIFRKNQKVAMAVLGVLVIFAFVLSDTLQNLSSSGMSPSYWAIISAVFGASILGGLGYSSGRIKEYAMTGFILGALLGMILPRFLGPSPAVESTAGNLTEKELADLVNRKQIANRFLLEAFDTTMSPMERQLISNPQFGQFIQQQRQQRFAPFAFGSTSEDDVVRTYLMNHEAKQMGITVSNETINDYIKALTLQADPNDSTKSNWLTPTQYHDILDRMGLDDGVLVDALREEIKAKMAMELINTPILATPDQYWRNYQKLNVKQELDAVALDVETFTEGLPEPQERDLAALFSQYREVFPNQKGPGLPGFQQPRRIKLEYIEGDYAAAEEEVLQSVESKRLTTKERETELKAELLRIKNAMAGVDKKIKDGTILKEDEIEEKDLAGQSEVLKLLNDGQEINRFDFEIAQYYEENKNFRYRNRLIPDDPRSTTNPFDSSSFFPNSKISDDKDNDKPAETQDDSNSSDYEPASAQKPVTDQQKQSPSPEKQPESDKSESPSTEKKKPTEPKKEKSDNESALLETEIDLFQVASFQDDQDGDKPDSKSKDDQKTDSNDSSKKGDDSKKTVDEAQAASTPDETIKISPARRGPAPPPLPEDPPLPRYRPLDPELKNEIREDLIDQKTTKLVNDRIADAMGYMRDLEDKYQEDLDLLRGIATENDEDKLNKGQADQLRSKIASDLKEYASEKKFVYGETDSLSYGEFLEPENNERYPIVSSVISSPNSFSRITIIDRVFSGNSENFSTSQAIADSGNQFAYWKTSDIESFTPKSLAAPRIREQVIHAWKMKEARVVILKRADALKKIVQKDETEMSEALKGQTLSGKEDDTNKLNVQPTESFSWLETGLQDPSNPFGQQQQTAHIWDISTIEKAGNEFMKVVFEELQDGDVGVAANFNKSVYYVVKVKNRSTSVPGSMGALRQGFKAEKFNNVIYNSLIQQSQQKTALNWSRRFFEQKYNLKTNLSGIRR